MVTKEWGKNARNNFSRNTPIERAKNVGKKIVATIAKKIFFYIHEYRDQKKGGKNERKNIYRNTPIVRAKNVRKNRSKKCEKTFFIITRIS